MTLGACGRKGFGGWGHNEGSAQVIGLRAWGLYANAPPVARAMSVLPISVCCYTRTQITALTNDMGPLPTTSFVLCQNRGIMRFFSSYVKNYNS